MNWQATLLSLVALIALGTYVLVYDSDAADQRAKNETSETQVFGGVEAGSVERLNLRTTDGIDAQLERRDGVWRLTRPVEAEADPVAADALVAALGSLESDAVYDEIEALGSYGLDVEPSLRFSAAGFEHSLRLGGTAPIGGGRYVTDDAGDRVWLVAAWRTSAFAKSLHQLREARLLRVDPAAVQSLSVRWPGGEVALRRGEAEGAGAWQLESPVSARARDRTVESLLSDLAFVRADAFVDAPTQAERSQFDSPAYRVEINLADEAEPLLFEVGAEGVEGRWLARGPSGVIAEISEAEVQSLPQTVSDFRFRELARFVPSEVSRFTLSFAGEDGSAVEGTRTEAGDWAFGEAALVEGAASRLLSALAQLEAIEIAADSMGDDELTGLGLAPARTRIQVLGEDEPLADIAFGAMRGDGAIAARSGASEIVYWLSAGLAQDLPVNRAAFDDAFRASEEAPAEESSADEASR